MVLTCDKCGQQMDIPSRNHTTCNRHIASEKTGYCQGMLHPAGQVSGGTYTAPTAAELNAKNGKEIGFQSQ